MVYVPLPFERKINKNITGIKRTAAGANQSLQLNQQPFTIRPSLSRLVRSRFTVVSTVQRLRCGLDHSGFESRHGLDIFLSSETSIPNMWPIQPSVLRVSSFSLCVERLGSDVSIYVVLKLRVSGVIPQLSLYAFVAWRGSVLHFCISIGRPTGRSDVVVSAAPSHCVGYR
jgi:hypothetical protein